MGKKENDEGNVRNRLKQKAGQGRSNLVEQILKQPEIQRTLIRQSLETAVFVSCLLIGVLTVVNAAKTALAVSWQVDLILGVGLITVFLVYVARKVGR